MKSLYASVLAQGTSIFTRICSMQVFSTIWVAQEDQHLELEIFVLVLEEGPKQ